MRKILKTTSPLKKQLKEEEIKSKKANKPPKKSRMDEKESDSGGYLSDSVFNFNPREEQLVVVHTANKKDFLKRTKRRQNLKVEDHLPKQF